MFTTGEAARILGVTAQTVINWIGVGTLPAVRVGKGRRRISAASMARFVEKNAIPAQSNAPDLWERLRSSLPPRETSLPAVIAADGRGVIVFWSDKAESLLGWTAQERIGMPLAELAVRVPGLPVDLADLAREPGEELRLSLHLEFEIKKPGARIYTETTLSWIRDSQGRMIGTVFVLEPTPVESPMVKPARKRRSPKAEGKSAKGG